MAQGTSRLGNVPGVADVRSMAGLLEFLGVPVRWTDEHEIEIEAHTLASVEAPYDLVRKMRASILVLGSLVARYGHARVSLPGGCAIGARPIDLHLKGMEKMGAQVTLDHGYVEVEAKDLHGAEIILDYPTVGGTENLMMVAVGAVGTTVIENAAREPEIVCLSDALNQMGARVEGAGTETIVVEGGASLKPFDYRVIPDRLEAGTFMIASAITGGDVRLRDCRLDHCEVVVDKLREAGAEITQEGELVRVRGGSEITSVDVRTTPHPGFPTDMQAQFMALMTLGRESCTITETVFENRFMHVSELSRMGADITLSNRTAVVRGVKALTGAPLMASDIRASASLVLAGLAARNTTEVQRIYHLDRGFERIEEKLGALGAVIERVPY